MIKKQGITVTMLVVTIMILIILAGTVTFSIYSTINYSKLSAWANEIIYIQDIVNEQMHKTSAMDFIFGDAVIDVSNIEDINEQFEGETISAANTVVLKVLDLGSLKVTNTIYGNGDTDKDVYAVSEQTGKVYYVQGLEVEGKTYYCITDSLRQRFELTTAQNNLSSIVFVPSIIGYTNQPITVLVKVPNTFTDINISTSNEAISVGEQQVKGTTYEYLINSGETPVAANYTVTVSYNDGAKNLTSTYEVNGYDITPPIIAPITDSNFVYKSTDTQEINYITNITATDESGIKILKYELGNISEQDAGNYFKDNGNLIIGGKINLGENIKQYTVYAEDNAGNFSVQTVKMTEKNYAIYSATDNSLTFARTDKKIKVGDTYNKKEITAIYTDFEQATYTSLESVPWNEYRNNIKSVSVEDIISPSSILNWFTDMTNCTTLNLEKLDVSKIEYMTSVFSGVGSDSSVTDFKITGLNNWDVSNVTQMNAMFASTGAKATAWDIGDLSQWNVSKVTKMNGMFKGAGNNAVKFNIGELDAWDVSNVTRFDFMFNCGIIATEWNIGKLDNWNTSKATAINSMFCQAGEKATTWDIGNLSTKEVVKEDGSKYTAWDVSSVIYMSSLFNCAGRNASKFALGDLNNWNVSSVKDMGYMFKWAGENSTSWDIGSISNWNTGNVTTMYQMFAYCGVNASKWDIGNLDNWNVSNVSTMYQMFLNSGQNVTTWNIGNLDNWNVSKVKSMAGMFNSSAMNVKNFNIGNLDNWDTSNVEDMSWMFQNAGKNSTTWNIGQLDKWNVSKVKNMAGMFMAVLSTTNATGQKFNIGDLSTKEIVREDGTKYIAWDVSGVTNMASMFQSIGRYADYDYENGYLDLTSWDVSSVTEYASFNVNVTSKIKAPAFK